MKLRVGDIVIYKPSKLMLGDNGGPGYFGRMYLDINLAGLKVKILNTRFSNGEGKYWIVGEFQENLSYDGLEANSFGRCYFAPGCLIKRSSGNFISRSPKNTPEGSD